MTVDWKQLANAVENPFIADWKGAGKKVVGYTCSYLPDEIFHAADILPYRLRGNAAEECSIGDTYFGPFICSLPKHLLQLVGEKRLQFLDGAIITPGCDSMRRIDECWRKADGDIGGIKPPFFFHFGVPHKYTDYTIRWFTDEILRLIDELQAHFDLEIRSEPIRASIRLYNRGRALLRRLDALRTDPESPIDGVEALAVIMAGSSMAREDYIRLLSAYIGERERAERDTSGRIRLMLVGSANDDIELVRLVQGDRAVVVADNLCFSARSHLDDVDEDGDPIDALARYYLSKNECPRMYGQYETRLRILKNKIQSANVDGVVLQNIRFCDMHGAENGLFDKDLEADGVPCLRIEREYGPLVEKGRLKIRLDAFLEKIARQKEARR